MKTSQYTWVLLILCCLASMGKASATPAITEPADHSQYSTRSQTFHWNAGGANISAYALTLGSSLGARDLYDSGSLSSDTLSQTVTDLEDIALIYVRLWYRDHNGVWRHTSTVARSATNSLPELYAPTPENTLGGSTATFEWRENSLSVNRYFIYVGDFAGSKDYFNQNMGTQTRAVVTGLPTDGRRLYVRFWYYTNQWHFIDYSYKAHDDGSAQEVELLAPEMVSPPPGALIHQRNITFGWHRNTFEADAYWLYAGSGLGFNDYLDSGLIEAQDQHTQEYNFNTVPLGTESFFVRMWFRSAAQGNWSFSDYQYNAWSYGGPMVFSPEPGSLLSQTSQTSQTFQWSSNGLAVDNYQLHVGDTEGGNELLESGLLDGDTLAHTFDSFPHDSQTLYVTLRYRVNGEWAQNSFRYFAPAQQGFEHAFETHIDQWEPINGDWEHDDDGNLSAEAGDHWATAVYRNGSFEDLMYSARVRRLDEADNPIFLNIRDSGTKVQSDCWCANAGCYTFEISPAQNYAVWSCQGDDWVQLSAIEHSDLIKPGTQWNEMRVLAIGESLRFYINGALAWQGTDNTHRSGQVGVGTVNFDDQSQQTLKVDWAQLKVLGERKNLAVDGTATQSSTSHGGVASYANDGNTSGLHSDRTVSHSSHQSQPWWQVDLGELAQIDSLNIYNRSGCCASRLSNVHVFVTETDTSTLSLSELLETHPEYYHYHNGAMPRTTTLDLPEPSFGRYVRVQLNGRNYLSLAEVEVVGRLLKSD